MLKSDQCFRTSEIRSTHPRRECGHVAFIGIESQSSYQNFFREQTTVHVYCDGRFLVFCVVYSFVLGVVHSRIDMIAKIGIRSVYILAVI